MNLNIWDFVLDLCSENIRLSVHFSVRYGEIGFLYITKILSTLIKKHVSNLSLKKF